MTIALHLPLREPLSRGDAVEMALLPESVDRVRQARTGRCGQRPLRLRQQGGRWAGVNVSRRAHPLVRSTPRQLLLLLGCEAGGDVFASCREGRIEFPQAGEVIASATGWSWSASARTQGRRSASGATGCGSLERTADYYASYLWEEEAAKAAIPRLRGLQEEICALCVG